MCQVCFVSCVPASEFVQCLCVYVCAFEVCVRVWSTYLVCLWYMGHICVLYMIYMWYLVCPEYAACDVYCGMWYKCSMCLVYGMALCIMYHVCDVFKYY